jgi:uncharacterized protein YhaN
MRFESFTIEKYGLIERRTLSFPPDPGLVVIYGPNEAGKSTALAAVADFLFGIPHNSPRGQVYGYDQMRLTADLVLADGTRLSLRRRKGRAGRTLTDENGKPVDEALLARHLGATGRERFSSLFGLDHNTLRNGGERLLAADGDIGRLIVEAGGGLRALTEAMSKMDADAGALFSTVRAGHRRFYKALDAYHAADRAAKDGLLTRDAYEEARRRESEAKEKTAEIRSKQKDIAETISRLQRLVRVIPAIRELDHVEEELASFHDLPPLRDGFAEAAEEALQILKQAEAALAEAEERRAVLAAKIGALMPSEAILLAETAIREIQEKAVHVRKARGDRANRQAELSERKARLGLIRSALGLAAGADLEAMSPPPEAIEKVQKLAAQGLERRAKLIALEEQLANEDRTLADLTARQDERRNAGTNVPLGVTGAEFANLAELCLTIEGAEGRAERIRQEIASRVRQLGFENIECLDAWVCPTASMIQAELDRRSRLEADISKIIEKTAAELMKRDMASGAIEHLLKTKEIPTSASIAQARASRDESWQAICDRYLSERGEAVAERALTDRKDDVERHRQQIEAADRLADLKSLEAGRLADLDLAQRQKSDAVIALEALEKQRAALESRYGETVHAWEEAWPDATKQQSDLGRLKALAEERGNILDRRAVLRALVEEIEKLYAAMAPRRRALEQVEAKLAIEAGVGASIAERVSAASRALKIHEDAYADYRHDEKALRDVTLRRQGIKASLDSLRAEDAAWRSAWAPAVSALGLAESCEPERANEIATQWVSAAGHIDVIGQTRRRLQRMDEDEKVLQEKIKAIAARLDFALPDDSLAAAAMLGERLEAERKTASEHRVLSVELKERTAEYERKQLSCEAALAQVASLCREAGCERAGLGTLAGRHRQLRAARNRRHTLIEMILQSGDGLPVEVLREQWGGRDLDNLKADLLEAEQEAARLTTGMEAALAEVQNRTRELENFCAAGGINEAVAARESAIAEIHETVECYLEIALARDLLSAAMEQIRAGQQDPLIFRAGALFSSSTQGAFSGIETDIDDHGNPVVAGRRTAGDLVPVAQMSDGVRDQLFLAFRIASIEQYCAAAEPLPFIADDLLVHFDDDRGAAALGLLAELGKTTQVMLFTHHRHVRQDAEALIARSAAAVIDLAGA